MIRRLWERRWENLGWGAIVSIALHLMIAAVLFVRLPTLESVTPAEESISVELVPPPEEKAPVPPPEEKPAQEEKAAETPPPPEEPKPEAQDEQSVDQLAGKVPLPVLRPVLEFGERDTGPKVDPSDLTKGAAQPEEQPKEEAAKPSKPLETAAVEKQPEAEMQAASNPQNLQLPDFEGSEPPAATDGETTTDAEAVQHDKAKSDAAKATEAPEDRLTEAKRIFSKSVTDDPVARTAMGDLPRGARIEQLCSTELFAQLKHASPPYNPELLPSFRLPHGTVLDIRRAAFRTNARWYDLSFRCEVDADATRVVSFAFDVGAEVPKREWRSRGFPTM